jgi:FkbM family methyltransferase
VSYTRLRRQGFLPNGIIDIGAHVGDWTRQVKAVFPAASVLMIEARETQRKELEGVCQSLKDVKFDIVLLGSETKDSVEFFVLNTGSSIYSERSNALRSLTQLPMKTLDELVVCHDWLKPPLFLKLDVQGAEVEVLKGGENALSLAELVQLEVPFASYNEGAPTAADVIVFMNSRGFVLFDVVGFVRYKDDLLQADFLFVRGDSKLRRDHVIY